MMRHCWSPVQWGTRALVFAYLFERAKSQDVNPEQHVRWAKQFFFLKKTSESTEKVPDTHSEASKQREQHNNEARRAISESHAGREEQ